MTAPGVHIAAADVNESASELQLAAEPLHITATLSKLAELRDTFHLPHPVGVRFTKCNSIGTVEVSTFGELMAWADRLAVPQDARHSSSFKDGSSSHSCWASWNGWHVRVVAYVDAPEPEVGERTIFSHCNWVGGCDTELTSADSMLCQPHADAPLADAIALQQAPAWGEWPS